MARVCIAFLCVAVLLRGYQAATVNLDAIDFMHTDDSGERRDECKELPEGTSCCLAKAAIALLRSRDP